jgi:hypothetical protein
LISKTPVNLLVIGLQGQNKKAVFDSYKSVDFFLQTNYKRHCSTETIAHISPTKTLWLSPLNKQGGESLYSGRLWMARLSIDITFFIDPRIDTLAEVLGLHRAFAQDKLLRFWLLCYEKRSPSVSLSVNQPLIEAMEKSGLAKRNEDGTFHICGVSDRIGYLLKASEDGKKSAAIRREKYGDAIPFSATNKSEGNPEGCPKIPSAKSEPIPIPIPIPIPNPIPNPNPKELELINITESKIDKTPKEAKQRPKKESSNETSSLVLSRKIWDAYVEGYKINYHVEPIRNARTNSLIKQFGARLGEIAPDVIKFYLTHQDSFYIKNLHSLNLAVSSAEALATQWKAGVKMTWNQAKKIDLDQSNQNVIDDWLLKNNKKKEN